MMRTRRSELFALVRSRFFGLRLFRPIFRRPPKVVVVAELPHRHRHLSAFRVSFVTRSISVKTRSPYRPLFILLSLFVYFRENCTCSSAEFLRVYAPLSRFSTGPYIISSIFHQKIINSKSRHFASCTAFHIHTRQQDVGQKYVHSFYLGVSRKKFRGEPSYVLIMNGSYRAITIFTLFSVR